MEANRLAEQRDVEHEVRRDTGQRADALGLFARQRDGDVGQAANGRQFECIAVAAETPAGAARTDVRLEHRAIVFVIHGDAPIQKKRTV